MLKYAAVNMLKIFQKKFFLVILHLLICVHRRSCMKSSLSNVNFSDSCKISFALYIARGICCDLQFQGSRIGGELTNIKHILTCGATPHDGLLRPTHVNAYRRVQSTANLHTDTPH
jgi:hypothetical protein